MESAKRFLSVFIFIAGLLTSDVSCALRSKMSGVVNDASDVTWAHAVNSRDALEKALAGPVDFLEADISLGHVEGSEQSTPIPIMAHPPDTISDISLDTWLNTVVTRRPEKGIKLDFKSIDVVEPSLIVLQKYSTKLNSSVWLNADVLSGPINASTIPVLVEKFLALCHQYFPDATLSTGWTTYWYPTLTEKHWHYDWQHVREMTDVIRCRGYEANHPTFTFPVRGIFASRSIKQLQWLLSTVPNSTLTVWSGRYDPLKVEDLLQIRASFPKDKVYYDVPEFVNDIFQEKKNSFDIPAQNLMPGVVQWVTLTRGQGESCSAMTFAKNDIIVFGKSLITAVLQKNVISLGEKENLKINGQIKFFDTSVVSTPNSGRGTQELTMVLTDVSLFSSMDSQEKFDLTVSDTDVIWAAINSSVIYTFRHEYGQEASSCRFFKLDTSQDKSFEVWTVPCVEEGSPEEMSKIGIPEISSRKRLVLPRGPFMLGFVSEGNEHVSIYNLKVETEREGSSTSGSSKQMSLGLLTVIVLSFCILCLVI